MKEVLNSQSPQCFVRPLPGIGEQRIYRYFAQPFAAHSHDHYVIGLIEEGNRKLRCNEKEFDVCAGDIIVFNPGDVHACEQSDGGILTYNSIAIDADLLDGATLIGPKIRNPETVALFGDITQAITSSDESAIGKSVLRLCESLSTKKDIDLKHHLNDEAACHVLAHFYGHLSDPETLEELASREGLSVYALIRAYRNRFSITPMRHLASLRVECACRLLAKGVEPATIAAEVGFADQAHLTRSFKQRIGITPAAYQKMIQIPEKHT